MVSILPDGHRVVHDESVDSARVTLMRQVLASTPWVDRTRSFARTLRTSTRVEHGLLLVGTPEDEPWHLAAHLDDETRFAGIPELAPALVRHRVPVNAPAHLSVGLERLASASRGETLFVVAPSTAPERLLDRVSDARRQGATILSMHTGDSDLESVTHESLILPPHGLIIPGNSGLTGFGGLGAQQLVVGLDLASVGTLLDAEGRRDGGDGDGDESCAELTPDVSFDVMSHLVSTAIGEGAITSSSVASATSATWATSATSAQSTHGRGTAAFRDRLGRLLDTISGASARDRSLDS